MAALVAWLFAVPGTYLLLQRALTRIVLGLGLLSHGAILLLITVGGRAGDPPLVGKDDDGLGYRRAPARRRSRSRRSSSGSA